MHLILGIDHSALSASAAESVCGMSWPTGRSVRAFGRQAPIASCGLFYTRSR